MAQTVDRAKNEAMRCARGALRESPRCDERCDECRTIAPAPARERQYALCCAAAAPRRKSVHRQALRIDIGSLRESVSVPLRSSRVLREERLIPGPFDP